MTLTVTSSVRRMQRLVRGQEGSRKDNYSKSLRKIVGLLGNLLSKRGKKGILMILNPTALLFLFLKVHSFHRYSKKDRNTSRN